MQEEIIILLTKKKKELPQWLLQPEIELLLRTHFKRNVVVNDSFHACFAKAMSSFRKYNDFKWVQVSNDDFKEILKKIGRIDLIDSNKKMFNNFTFGYKIK